MWPFRPRFHALDSGPFRVAVIYEYGVLISWECNKLKSKPTLVNETNLTYFLSMRIFSQINGKLHVFFDALVSLK